MVGKNMLQIVLSEIKKIEAQVQQDGYVSLSQGALKIGGIPQEIKCHLQQVLETDKTDYYQSAWGIFPLRERIAEHLSRDHNVCFSHRNVLVTHGCMGAISTLLLALLDEGDEVILPEPTYPAYKNIVGLARGKHRFVCLDMDEIVKARTSKTKMMILSNPCNPTGELLSKSMLEALVQWCDEHKVYLIVDESYDDYIFDGDFFSATPFVLQSSFVIRTGSYSKSLSMSGWRVGFMVVSDELSARMGVTQDALLNCPNVIAQHAVLYALDHPEYTARFHGVVRANRDIAVKGLQSLVDRGLLSFSVPAAGFYLFLKTKQRDAYDLCLDILKHAKVGLIPGRAFGPSGTPFLRLCYARQREVLLEGIDRITRYFLTM